MYKLLLLAFAASASALSFQGGCAPVIASRASAVGALFVAEPSCAAPAVLPPLPRAPRAPLTPPARLG